jgi:hypothetical protein
MSFSVFAAMMNAGWFLRSRRCLRRMKNQNTAKVVTNMIATGMTTAGIIVLRLDDDLPLVEAPIAVEEAWLEIVCVFESDEDAAAAADSELYCAGSVTTEVAVNVPVDNAPPASVTMLTEVKDSVVNEVGAAAEVIASVPNEVTKTDICVGSVAVLSVDSPRGVLLDESANFEPMMSVPFQLSNVIQILRGGSRKAVGEKSKCRRKVASEVSKLLFGATAPCVDCRATRVV